VVSVLMAAANPCEAAQQLKAAYLNKPKFFFKQNWKPSKTLKVPDIKGDVSKILRLVRRDTPLVHHLTNNVPPFVSTI